MTIYKVTIFSNVKKYVFLNGSNVSFLNELDLNPFSKSNFNLYEASSLTVSTLLHRLVLSLELGTNWDRKGWPGSEIQMYYSSPCGLGKDWGGKVGWRREGREGGGEGRGGNQERRRGGGIQILGEWVG